MKFEKRSLKDDFTVHTLSEIINNPKGIEYAVLDAVKGRIIITNNEGLLIGCYSVEHTSSGVDEIRGIPVIVDGVKEPIENQLKRLLEINDWHGLIPIVDSNKILKGAITCIPEKYENHMQEQLSYLSYLYEKQIDIGYYFYKRNIRRVAFWGLNMMSLTFANCLRNSEYVSVYGIYEHSKNKKYINTGYLNYEITVYFENGLTSLVNNSDIDAIIITDWTLRNARKIEWVSQCKEVVYFNDLLSDWDFKRHINEYIYYKFAQSLHSKNVDFIKVRIPTDDDLKLPHKAEKFSELDRKKWLSNEIGEEVDSEAFKEFNNSRIEVMSNFSKAKGQIFYLDYKSKYFNFCNKQRIVFGQPEMYDNTIYLFGPCMVAGLYNQDKQTVAYYLQEFLLSNDKKYRVVAYGVPNDADRYYFPLIFRDEEFRSGDIVVCMETTYRISSWEIDLIEVYKEYVKKWGNDFYYDNTVHTGKLANIGIAEVLYKNIFIDRKIENSSAVNEIQIVHKNNEKRFEGNADLNQYKKYLLSEAIHKKERIGCIVMNCNPFTLGHQYLIEYAASKVDILYVFVVEEDKSMFKFQDRKQMVILGTKHLDNVKVLDSGKFIISAITFSEYFEKADIQGATIDTSLDVETFAQHIAPTLDITVRFVGTEPNDFITKQYNESMKKILPQYGIELIEVLRREHRNNAISASRVREYMKDNQWSKIEEIVPKTTYDYLIKNYKEC